MSGAEDFTIEKLIERLGVNTSAFESWQKKLRGKGYTVDPIDLSGTIAFSQEQVDVFETFKQHLDDGKALSSFPRAKSQKASSKKDKQNSEKLIPTTPTSVEPSLSKGFTWLSDILKTDISVILEFLSSLASSRPSVQPGTKLADFRELEEACQGGWKLSTGQVASLLEITPGTVCKYGDQFEDAGFVFTREGHRKGGKGIAWVISKPPRQIPPTIDVEASS